MATLQPSAMSWRASSRPMPVPPPVTTAIRPAKSFMGIDDLSSAVSFGGAHEPSKEPSKAPGNFSSSARPVKRRARWRRRPRDSGETA